MNDNEKLKVSWSDWYCKLEHVCERKWNLFTVQRLFGDKHGICVYVPINVHNIHTATHLSKGLPAHVQNIGFESCT